MEWRKITHGQIAKLVRCKRKFALVLQNETRIVKEVINISGSTWKGWVKGAREQRCSSSIMQRWVLQPYEHPIAFQYKLIHAMDMLCYRVRKALKI